MRMWSCCNCPGVSPVSCRMVEHVSLARMIFLQAGAEILQWLRM
jgi:hypothetical protein